MRRCPITPPRRPVASLALACCALALTLAACSAPPAGEPTAGQPTAGRTSSRTQDPRVKSYLGQTPPDVFEGGTWVSRAGPTSLAALRGRVVYVMFAFPR